MLNSQDIISAEKNRSDYVLTAALLLLEDEEEKEKEKELEELKDLHRRQRTLWSREWLLRRHDFGEYDKLLEELHSEDPEGYKNYLRVTPDLFHEMVERLTPYLKKKKTFMRDPLEVGLKLAITLRFLATGNSYQSL